MKKICIALFACAIIIVEARSFRKTTNPKIIIQKHAKNHQFNGQQKKDLLSVCAYLKKTNNTLIASTKEKNHKKHYTS